MLRKTRPQRLTVELLETKRLLAGDIAFAESVTYSVGNAPSNIVTGDVDGDGSLDLLVSNWGCCGHGVQVLLGNGDGTFAKQRSFGTETTTNSKIDVADFDSDGYLDVVSRHIFLNLGESGDAWNGFSSPPVQSTGFGARSVVAADVDRDGDTDMVLARGSSVQVLLNNHLSDGEWLGFADPLTFDTGKIAVFGASVGNVNNDDHLDLVVESVVPNGRGAQIGEISVLLGNGDGTFELTEDLCCMVGDNYPTVRLADWDGDQNVDIIVFANSNNGRNWPVDVFFGRGDGTFGEPAQLPVSVRSWSRTWIGDLDVDGDSDIVAVGERSGVHFLINDGSEGFHEAEHNIDPIALPQALAVADLNGDGRLDVAIATAFNPSGRDCHGCGVEVYLNITEAPSLPGDSNRDGVFDSSDLVLVFQAGEYEDQIQGNSTFAEGDWNGDGDFDSSDLVYAFQAGTYVAAAISGSEFTAIQSLFESDEDASWKLKTANPKTVDIAFLQEDLTTVRESRR